jgi:hypothetical protein
MRQSHTAVLARNELWRGAVATEPFEVAWASEAIFFVRVLEPVDFPPGTRLSVEISPDGMHWCDHGTSLALSGDPSRPASVTVTAFGGWLRLSGEVPEGCAAKVIAYLALKE